LTAALHIADHNWVKRHFTSKTARLLDGHCAEISMRVASLTLLGRNQKAMKADHYRSSVGCDDYVADMRELQALAVKTVTIAFKDICNQGFSRCLVPRRDC
jgi:hypothetical protein